MKLKVGTRASKLALEQTNIVLNALKQVKELKDLIIEIVPITTSGDKNLIENPNTLETSLKGAFTKEIEEAMLKKEIDFAIHSMKDMPTVPTAGLVYASVPKREDPRDVLISKNNLKINELKANSIIGTTSLRRSNFIQAIRNDITIKPIRGNIQTRLDKLNTQDYDALVLAYAGIKRLKLENIITEYFDIDTILPAPAQGTLCLQCRKDDEKIINILKLIEDKNSRIITDIERQFAYMFDSGCNSPIGCYGEIINNEVILHGAFFKDKKIYRDKAMLSEVENIENIAIKLYEKINNKMKN